MIIRIERKTISSVDQYLHTYFLIFAYGGRTLGGVGDGFGAPRIILGCRMLHLPGRVYNNRGCGQLDLRLTSPGSHQDATPS